jgi:A/G-specific adenine glycosylase
VVPAVDGNVKRVLSRLFDLVDPTPGEYQELAQDLVDPARPGDFNQALMELGAIVCIPRSPRCPECTVAPECLALERGTVTERPATKKKKPVPELDISVLVALAEDLSGDAHLLLRKRPAKGLLAGMWEFPGVEVGTSEFEEAGFKSGAWSMALELGLDRGPGKAPPPTSLTELELVTHVFSHLKARYRPYLLRVGPEGLSDLESNVSHSSGSTNPENPPVWIRVDDLEEVPLPVAQGKIARAALERSSL